MSSPKYPSAKPPVASASGSSAGEPDRLPSHIDTFAAVWFRIIDPAVHFEQPMMAMGSPCEGGPVMRIAFDRLLLSRSSA